MRVAFVTPYLPCPANTGGRIRMHRLARALAARGDVWLYACAGLREAAAQRERPELTLFASTHVRNSDLGAVPPWFTSRRVRKSGPARLANDLRDDHARVRFDAIVVEHSYALATASRVHGVPVLVDEHNIESRYQAEYFAAEGRAGWRARREVELLAAWERVAWRGASRVTCVSERDAEVVRGVRAGPVDVIANGTALDEVSFIPASQRRGGDVLFVGLMSHAPNVTGALFLAREVMPRVWRDEPAARLVLCGRTPTRELLALASPRIEVTGTVESVGPYLSRAAVYANALFQGAGSSLKVPEALASGLPIVSTLVGVRGFPLEPGTHFDAAEDAEGFARGIVRALRTRDQLDGRSERGRAVAEGYDWRTLGVRFASIVESMVGDGPHGG
ncbi:MAG: glycosyltransferase family 4 protein [Deltaproteobacteria bacterium]